ncbi:MAG: tripartite tricarboxylate transporter TctB family protein [Deltaproteobacteria bacterium]|nr:tripartite tricarboxylate transporter TctB family protein [Deltaproteobacteria bacterium]
MKTIDQYSSLFWFIVGIAITLSSLKYGIGSLSQPGAGFITFFPGIIISLLSAVLFISSGKDHDNVSGLRDLWVGFDIKHVAFTILLLLVYILAFKPVGFVLSTFILLFVLFRLKSSYNLRIILVMSVVVTIVSYMIFALLLRTQLPKGIFEGII